MKKILFLLTALIFSCENQSLESKKKKVDQLKNSLVEINSEIDKLEKEIIELDSSFIQNNYELISTIKPINKSFIHEVELRGNVQSKKNILLVPEVVGRFKTINVKEGQLVKKGEILASINSDLIQNNLEEIKTNMKLLETIYLRQKNLWENNIGSEIDYLRAKSNFQSTKSRYNSIKVQASKFNILAPFSGIIDDVLAKEGEMASPSMPSFRMFNDNYSYINLEIAESYNNSFKVKDSVKIISNNMIINSFIESISQVINPINRTFSIEVAIPQELSETVKPNQILTVKLVDYKNDNAITMRNFTKEKFKIYHPGGNIGSALLLAKDIMLVGKKIPILIGKSFNYYTEVISGLKGNETVIDMWSSEVRDGAYVMIKN